MLIIPRKARESSQDQETKEIYDVHQGELHSPHRSENEGKDPVKFEQSVQIAKRVIENEGETRNEQIQGQGVPGGIHKNRSGTERKVRIICW